MIFDKKIDKNFADSVIKLYGGNLGEVSDGYHTFNELYAHRHGLSLCLFTILPSLGINVVKSKTAKEGELCFGGGWFVALAELPTGQVSYHFPIDMWDKLDVEEVERSTWDGHTSNDVIDRLMEATTPLSRLVNKCKWRTGRGRLRRYSAHSPVPKGAPKDVPTGTEKLGSENDPVKNAEEKVAYFGGDIKLKDSCEGCLPETCCRNIKEATGVDEPKPKMSQMPPIDWDFRIPFPGSHLLK